MSCPTHIADPSFQIGAGPTGPYDCTAHACSDAIDHATCGAKDPGGRAIRLQSNERKPDPSSPGLNLPQVAAVAAQFYGVNLDVHVGSRKVSWAEYEKRRLAGQGCIVQMSYAPIALSSHDAGRGFRGNHAMFESIHATYDPLADGRAPGVFRYNQTVYPRELIKNAAGKLVIGAAGPGPLTPGYGWVWAAFTRDVVPSYMARVPEGKYWAYAVVDGKVQYRRLRATGGFSGACTPPRSYPWPSQGGTVTLVKMTSGVNTGRYISANYAKEV